ncbi:MAG: hypothetical protein GY756_09825 [bacterium]|nr:hypothetical protein [bacterium]
MTKYYSIDNEGRFYEDLKEQLDLYLENYTGEIRDGMKIPYWEGTAKPTTILDFFCYGDFVETIQENASGECGECAEDYLDSINPQAKSDLEKFISDWADKHKLQPSFSAIENVTEKVAILKNCDKDNNYEYSFVEKG